MTPEFSAVVTPIYFQVLTLLDDLAAGEPPSLDEVMARTRTWIESADRRAASSRELAAEFALARYGLVAWIDEVLVDSNWGKAAGWGGMNHVLEFVFYGTRNCFKHFYEEAKAAEVALEQKRATSDPLETYYVCVAMGFLGRGAQDPEFLDAWVKNLDVKLELYSPAPPRPFPQKDLPSPGLTPRRGAEVLLRVSLLVALTAVVTVIAYITTINTWYDRVFGPG